MNKWIYSNNDIIEQDKTLEIEGIKKEKDKYYQMTLDYEIQINELYGKLEKIKEICNCSKEPLHCDVCPMDDECEELCVNDENLQNIILQIINEGN